MAKAIRAETATVYFAPTANRRYITKRAAVRAEARALLTLKYPPEPAEYDESGRCTYAGWSWQDEPRSDELLRRVCRLVVKTVQEKEAEK